MNEEALQQLYSLARGEGYSKSFEDFKVLMGSNEDAINNVYNVAQNEGYRKDINQFKTLVGFGGGETVEVETQVQEEVPVKKKKIRYLHRDFLHWGYHRLLTLLRRRLPVLKRL